MASKKVKMTIKLELDREDYEFLKKLALRDPKIFSKLLIRGYKHTMGGVF